MLGSNCTVEDYSAWRREQIMEAADLPRYITYHDLSAWQRIKDIQTEASRARPFDGATDRLSRVGRALHTLWARLAHFGLRLSQRQSSSDV